MNGDDTEPETESVALLPSGSIKTLRAELEDADPILLGNEQFLSGVLAGCGDCIKVLDLNGRLQFMSEGGKRVMEVDDFSQLKGCPWPDFWAGEGSIHARRAVDTAKLGKVARFQGPANTARGTPKYWDVQVSPINGPDGQPTHLLSISRDITEEWRAQNELKEAVKQQRLLTDELQHRIKNTLAMVSAIANQTMRGSDVSAARDAFAARLTTLNHAHDILTKTSWASAPILDVVEAALAPHRTGQRRINIHGPEIKLESKQALAIALAIHELATNATKYGALSNSNGKVDISWSVDAGEADPKFMFQWSESNGPIVTEPAHRGFGSRLIEQLLANDFGANVRIIYDPSGVVCRMQAPLSHLRAQ